MADCRKLLTQAPVPLYSDEFDIAVLWSAKAGCTFAIKWLYYQEGILDEALAYAAWPHRYRQDVYYKRAGYFDKLKRIPELGGRAIKFVRNPYDRAVSSYLAFAHAASRPEPQHPHVLEGIAKHLGRPIGRNELFTFREFVSFLGSVDLDAEDIHLRRQTHGCERAGKLREMTVIRVEDSVERLPELEARFGLRASDYRYLRRSQHHTKRVDNAGFAGDIRFGTTVGVPVPRSRAFYDDGLLAQVTRLYGPDIERYGYTFGE